MALMLFLAEFLLQNSRACRTISRQYDTNWRAERRWEEIK